MITYITQFGNSGRVHKHSQDQVGILHSICIFLES